MSREIKIVVTLIAALVITAGITKLFINNTPRINKSLVSFNSIAKAGQSIVSDFFTKKITPTPVNIILTPPPLPTPTYITTTITPVVTNPVITSAPIPEPTVAPTTVPLPSPSPILGTGSCPTTSLNSYNTIHAERSSGDMPLNGDPVNSPEINLRLRGFGPVNESPALISRNGNAYGLDNQMPPQISSLYGGPVPQIVKTYVVYEWDFQNNKSLAPQQATPNYKVHLIGLQATPGQKLVGLTAGRKIDSAGDVFMVMYATKTDITFTHSPSDSLLGGYLFYFVDLCVDPNLLAAYQKDNAAGRNDLPVVAPGQIFGTAGTADVKVGIRDTMSFVDPRYKQDWWSWNGTAN